MGFGGGSMHAQPVDPNHMQKKPILRLLDGLVRHADSLSCLLLLMGLLGLLALPLVERTVKFDEKSLMVGNAYPRIRWAGMEGHALSFNDAFKHACMPIAQQHL